MTTTIALALGIVVVAIALLAMDRIPIEVSSITIVVLLVLAGLVTPDEALSGFSSETAIFIFTLLALTQGLEATGVMKIVARRMLVFATVGPQAFVMLLLVVVCAFSSVASNTAVTAAFLPVSTAVSARLKIPARALLLPVAYASMLGGTIFLFGTSTNLVVSAAMHDFGMGRIGFAELAPVGIPLAVLGLAATHFFVKRLLPEREVEETAQLPAREYVMEADLSPGSRFAGEPLRAVIEGIGIRVQGIVRRGATLPPDPAEILLPGDHLIVIGTVEDVLRVKELRSLGVRRDLRVPAKHGEVPALVEAVVPPTSVLAGRSILDVHFADRYGLTVIAVYRHPTLQASQRELNLLDSLKSGDPLKSIPLAVGDLLLLRGPPDRVSALLDDEDLTVLRGIDYDPPRYRRAGVALAIFAATVIVAGMRLTSPAIAGLAGMVAMIATGSVNARAAFRVDWRVVIMIGALLTLGRAVEKSGAGEYLAQGILPLADVVGPQGVLGTLMLLTVLLSIPMSNQAAALIMLPVSLHAAADLGVDPRTFALGTCLAASCAFLTPLEPSAALVYGPGRYRFSDFLLVGTPLTVLLLVFLTIVVPVVWPFTVN